MASLTGLKKIRTGLKKKPQNRNRVLSKVIDYNIFPQNSNDVFNDVCKLLSQKLTGFKKQEMLVDVDGSMVQTFKKGNAEVDVYDDYAIGAIYVKSNINLSSYLKPYISAHALRPALKSVV